MIGKLPAFDAATSFSLEHTGARAGTRESRERANGRVDRPENHTDGELAPEQQRVLRELQQTDRKVRAHEMAHVAAGAGLVSKGASYSYQTGPDGQRYAVAGEVSIDTSPGRTPEETIDKARRIKAAALAPADPSPQDRSVAATADRMAVQAAMELATREREEAGSSGPTASLAGGQPQPIEHGVDRRPTIDAAYGQFMPTPGTRFSGIDLYA